MPLKDDIFAVLVKHRATAFVTVSDYPCSDSCGPGPRVILRSPGIKVIPICMNSSEFAETMRKKEIEGTTGEAFAKAFFS